MLIKLRHWHILAPWTFFLYAFVLTRIIYTRVNAKTDTGSWVRRKQWTEYLYFYSRGCTSQSCISSLSCWREGNRDLRRSENLDSLLIAKKMETDQRKIWRDAGRKTDWQRSSNLLDWPDNRLHKYLRKFNPSSRGYPTAQQTTLVLVSYHTECQVSNTSSSRREG